MKTKKPPKRPDKQSYSEPKLTTYGDLKTMTLAKGGLNPDGGSNPKTRVQTGGPG